MADWRYLVQDAVTKEFLHTDVQLRQPEITHTLSGTGVLTATVGPVIEFDELFPAWGTIVSAERDGEIVGSFIPVPAKFDNAQRTASVECISFAGYPSGLPFDGIYREWAADPLDMFRLVWDHLQSYPDGDLGVTVDPLKSNRIVGSRKPPRKPVRPRRSNYGSAAAFEAAKDDWDDAVREWERRYGDFRPYELLWWEKPDCGKELNQLAGETPFDYVEEHYWNEDRTEILHHIALGEPRFGRRRHDITFTEGENLRAIPQPQRNGDRYSNYVLALGKGEGRKMRRVMVGRPNGRLRRVAVTSHKGVGRINTLRSRAHRALGNRQNNVSVEQFVVNNHDNARIGSWSLGDEVFLQTYSGLQPVEKWCRILEWVEKPDDSDSAVIKVAS